MKFLDKIKDVASMETLYTNDIATLLYFVIASFANGTSIADYYLPPDGAIETLTILIYLV